MFDAMDPHTLNMVLLAIVSAVFGVIGWLLNRAIAKQDKEGEDRHQMHQKAIDLLFTKHDEDAERLRDLERVVDREYYPKGETDSKFDEVKGAIRDGFADMRKGFEDLRDALLAHISKGDAK